MMTLNDIYYNLATSDALGGQTRYPKRSDQVPIEVRSG
jgi:hypothetical protein